MCTGLCRALLKHRTLRLVTIMISRIFSGACLPLAIVMLFFTKGSGESETSPPDAEVHTYERRWLWFDIADVL